MKPAICSTVGELIEVLSKFPRECRLVADGPDGGGYDVTRLPAVTVDGSGSEFDEFLGPTVIIEGVHDSKNRDLWDLQREHKQSVCPHRNTEAYERVNHTGNYKGGESETVLRCIDCTLDLKISKPHDRNKGPKEVDGVKVRRWG